MKKLLFTVVVLSGCSSVGPGLANHPLDCAMGIAWADCLPGTKGYENGGGQIHREKAQNTQNKQAQQLKENANAALEQMPN